MSDSILPPSEGEDSVNNHSTQPRESAEEFIPPSLTLAAFSLFIENASPFEEFNNAIARMHRRQPLSVERKKAASDLRRQRAVIRAITKLPLDAERARIVEDLCAIKALPRVSTKPSTLCRPDPQRLFYLKVVDEDWETRAGLLNEVGFTQVGEGIGIVHFQVGSVRISVRKLNQDSIINVASVAEPKYSIKNFGACCRALQQIIEAVQQDHTQDAHLIALIAAPESTPSPVVTRDERMITLAKQEMKPKEIARILKEEYPTDPIQIQTVSNRLSQLRRHDSSIPGGKRDR